MPRARTSFAFAVLGALGAGACGPSSSGPAAQAGASCDPVSPCGGDVAGTWQIDSSCLTITPPFAEAACQDAVGPSTFSASGTVTYTPAAPDAGQGTESVNAEFAFDIHEIFSDACLVALGLQGPSTQACDGLQAYFAGPYAVTCVPSGSTCDCDFADDQKVQDSDTYAVDGATLTLASSGPVAFCRTGSALVESSASGSSASRLALHWKGP